MILAVLAPPIETRQDCTLDLQGIHQMNDVLNQDGLLAIP